MPNETLNQAIKEAYASAPPDICLDTIEVYHPAFVDDDGNPTPARYVNDGIDLTAYLEADAPLRYKQDGTPYPEGGTEVTFLAGGFNLETPELTDKGVSELTLTISNTSTIITRYIELAMQNPQPIDIIYRPYVMSDLSGPAMNPPLYMKSIKIDVDLDAIRLTASFNEWVNKRYPGEIYTPERFRGLVR